MGTGSDVAAQVADLRAEGDRLCVSDRLAAHRLYLAALELETEALFREGHETRAAAVATPDEGTTS